LAIDAKRALVEPAHPQLSIARQCELLGLPRSTYYYCSHGESPENLHVMRLLDKKYTETPYYGIRRMTAWLQSEGYNVNHKRVARLLRKMGLEAIYPKPRTTVPHPQHRIYPYLLRGVWVTALSALRADFLSSMGT
jgi:putative transposase